MLTRGLPVLDSDLPTGYLRFSVCGNSLISLQSCCTEDEVHRPVWQSGFELVLKLGLVNLSAPCRACITTTGPCRTMAPAQPLAPTGAPTCVLGPFAFPAVRISLGPVFLRIFSPPDLTSTGPDLLSAGDHSRRPGLCGDRKPSICTDAGHCIGFVGACWGVHRAFFHQALSDAEAAALSARGNRRHDDRRMHHRAVS